MQLRLAKQETELWKVAVGRVRKELENNIQRSHLSRL
jgi:hypothetical protein